MRLLKELNGDGRTIIVVTHDMNVARNASRMIHLRDGVLNESEWTHVTD